jgi:serine/threonine protein kinase/formylglycine-generating enzyme required for sulfatase activity
MVAEVVTNPPRPNGAPAAPQSEDLPERIGRYRIERLLGRGGFGLVYLAHDDQLNRPVAVKVPHANRVARPEDAELYLAEARTVASLEHPHIVPVYDVGSTAEHPFFVVSKYVEETDLATKLKESRLSWQQAAELVATVAEALHYAHKRGFVHRDVKPGNILIDSEGSPHIVDFGLALREENIGKGPKYAGTPAYMSPEQARGEGHRVDGRSDIFSLGIVYYELLAGRPPFRGDTQIELLEQITTQEPRPPRQIDDHIPKELDRICLKALSKRASERYSAARDMAEDLRHFLAEQTLNQQGGDVGKGSVSPAVMPVLQPPSTSIASSRSGATSATVTTPSSDSQPIKIVPKGLRSFDAHDADFFLELLPGPRDRDGLPDSIRFWKTRIEATDPDSTFSVGLIYGPSGCGKSSLVKAGLLPRLSEDVIAVYVEATAEETEARVLNGLRKRCAALSDNLSLKETMAALRRGQRIPVGKKVLIVLDQFEQWLHAKQDEDNTELVQALRQCEGGRVQCIVMVRDDFWMAATRFMRELEIRLVEGHNSAAVDLFDIRHAEKVLAAFGRAFGVLPESSREATKDEKQFLQQAVNGLAQDGKVVCVRLALFSEMMKGKPWSPATLKEVGGTEGIGVTFLEETFSASTAPPEHRFHQKAARAVLKAMLPESGTDIKGNMRSRQELMEASGCEDRPKDFEDLIRILDSEIRLITPTDPDGSESTDDSEAKVEVGQKYYQLTHDYLVHSLRDWLTRKQKETRRGRADLRLAERASLWNAKPENRHLPSLYEFLNIRLLTDKKQWTEAQRRMMGRAGRFYAVRIGIAIAVVIFLANFVAVLSEQFAEARNEDHANYLVQSLLAANTDDVVNLIGEIDHNQRWARPLLKNVVNSKEISRRQKLHASLALLRDDPSQADYVFEQLRSVPVEEVPVIITLLNPQRGRVQERLWETVKSGASSERLRGAAVLAAYDRQNAEWQKVAPDVVTSLMSVAPTECRPWIALLRPVGALIAEPLEARYRDRSPARDAERPLAAAALADYLNDHPKKLTDLILLADNDREFQPFLEALRPHRSACVEEFRPFLSESPSSDAKPDIRDGFWKKQANAAICLLALGEQEAVWPLLKHSPNPSLRSFIIDRLARLGADYKTLAERLVEEAEPSTRQALILALGDFDVGKFSTEQRQKLVETLSGLYRHDPDSGVHSAVAWTLRQYQSDQTVTRLDTELQKASTKGGGMDRHWFINSEGQTFIVVDGPVEFLMGETNTATKVTIAYRFAMATHEVTVEQFQKFRSGYKPYTDYAPDADCPANFVSWYDAAAYCNWLSQQEGIPKEQWCYEGNDKGDYATGMKIPADYVKRTGYRLPTVAEWEYNCRAKTNTSYSFGEPEELLRRYAWYSENSHNRSWPVGRLRPNALGLFDMHGNAWERCHDSWHQAGEKANAGSETVKDEHHRVLRGGAFSNQPSDVRFAKRAYFQPAYRSYVIGFRPARTYP